MKAIQLISGIFGLALSLLTLVSLLPSNWWVLRATDLVREPLIYALAAILVISLFAGGPFRWSIAAIMLLAIAINAWRIWPYTRLASTQVELARDLPSERCFTALSANVFMDNTDHDRMIAQIELVDPDILLLTEIDQDWADSISPILNSYEFVRVQPQDDTFGKIFASRLPVLGFRIAEQIGENTPTLHAILQTPDDRAVEFIGLHPQAPMPGDGPDTAARNASIINAAERATDDYAGGIAMGDFNDVPWSRTTTRFREISGWLDPRIGRGTYPTFPSSTVPFGWPLDQIMVKGDVKIRRFEVLDANGSDHRAILGEFCMMNAAIE